MNREWKFEFDYIGECINGTEIYVIKYGDEVEEVVKDFLKGGMIWDRTVDEIVDKIFKYGYYFFRYDVEGGVLLVGPVDLKVV